MNEILIKRPIKNPGCSTVAQNSCPVRGLIKGEFEFQSFFTSDLITCKAEVAQHQTIVHNFKSSCQESRQECEQEISKFIIFNSFVSKGVQKRLDFRSSIASFVKNIEI